MEPNELAALPEMFFTACLMNFACGGINTVEAVSNSEEELETNLRKVYEMVFSIETLSQMLSAVNQNMDSLGLRQIRSSDVSSLSEMVKSALRQRAEEVVNGDFDE